MPGVITKHKMREWLNLDFPPVPGFESADCARVDGPDAREKSGQDQPLVAGLKRRQPQRPRRIIEPSIPNAPVVGSGTGTISPDIENVR
jgi:hypothetical protein